uniref:ATP-dependent helicase NAM7 n=1 Tax=Solanum tuberosum TaxID=4113 RepID=M1BC80_SOLTU
MATIAYKSDDEYSTISYKGDIGFVDFDKYKSVYSYNPNEESDIVVISVPFPLIEGKPKSGFVGETVVDSITIENTTNETVELWSIKIYDSKPEDSFTLSLMKPPTACSDLQYVEEFMESFSLEDRMLQPGRPLTVWLTCKPKEIGLHTSAVHFNVGDDNIGRLVFVLAEDKVSQSLASSRPFHRNRRKKAPAVDVGFVGGSRPMRDSYSIFRHKLLSYPIPRDEDMRDYDMESVTMKRRGPHFLSLHVPGLAERRPSLVDGDHIFAKLATTYASEIITPYQGYIHRIEAEEVFLKFDKEFHDNHVGRNLYNVQFAFNRMGVRRLYQAIEATESLDGEILFPSVISSTRNIQAAVLAPLNSCMLNKEQTSAVEKILGCEGGAPYVIHGPPGTGKTRTLIEAIIQLHIMRKDARVLVCAPSNSAADHILEKLVSQQNVEVQEHEIFRLNALTRLLDDVNPSCLRFCNVEDNAFKCPLLRELRRYRVIISTYASAFLLYAQGIKRGHLSHIFLDKAGQASEPDTMIPLSHLLRKETVVVLAGDPRQLGPVVFSKDAERYGLGRSYMDVGVKF